MTFPSLGSFFPLAFLWCAESRCWRDCWKLRKLFAVPLLKRYLSRNGFRAGTVQQRGMPITPITIRYVFNFSCMMYSRNFTRSWFFHLVNCTWANWESWGECTKTCDGGSQMRSRRISQPSMYGGEECSGSPAILQACNTAPCPAGDLFVFFTTIKKMYLWPCELTLILNS